MSMSAMARSSRRHRYQCAQRAGDQRSRHDRGAGLSRQARWRLWCTSHAPQSSAADDPERRLSSRPPCARDVTVAPHRIPTPGCVSASPKACSPGITDGARLVAQHRAGPARADAEIQALERSSVSAAAFSYGTGSGLSGRQADGYLEDLAAGPARSRSRRTGCCTCGACLRTPGLPGPARLNPGRAVPHRVRGRAQAGPAGHDPLRPQEPHRRSWARAICSARTCCWSIRRA